MKEPRNTIWIEGKEFVAKNDPWVEGLLAKIDRYEKALKNLVAKLKIVHDDSRYQGIWNHAHVHGLRYDGPMYDKELKEAASALGEGK